jgi:hypothetical protein
MRTKDIEECLINKMKRCVGMRLSEVVKER